MQNEKQKHMYNQIKYKEIKIMKYKKLEKQKNK